MCAGVRRDDRHLPDRRDDARLPAPDRPRRGAGRSWSRPTRRRRGCSAPTRRPTRSTRRRSSSTSATIEPSLAGPRRPQDRVSLKEAKAKFAVALDRDAGDAEEGRPAAAPAGGAAATTAVATAVAELPAWPTRLDHGAVVIAAITSCTNTSNPSVMIGAGLLAKKAVERGLTRKPWVKTQPGARLEGRHRVSREGRPDAVSRQLGFNLVGYGCTTCIGNSGPLPDEVVGDHRGEEPGRRLGAERQPQLRGPHPAAGARQLPGVAAAGRRLRAGRHDDRST